MPGTLGPKDPAQQGRTGNPGGSAAASVPRCKEGVSQGKRQRSARWSRLSLGPRASRHRGPPRVGRSVVRLQHQPQDCLEVAGGSPAAGTCSPPRAPPPSSWSTPRPAQRTYCCSPTPPSSVFDHFNFGAIAWPAWDRSGRLNPPPPEHILDALARAHDPVSEEDTLMRPSASTVWRPSRRRATCAGTLPLVSMGSSRPSAAPAEPFGGLRATRLMAPEPSGRQVTLTS